MKYEPQLSIEDYLSGAKEFIYKEQYGNACALLGEAIKKGVTDPKIYDVLADATFRDGLPIDDARVWVRRANRLEWQTSTALGWLCFNNGEFETAECDFKRARDANPTESGPHQGVLACARKLRRFSDFDSLYAEYSETFKDKPGIIYEKGWCLIEKMDYRAAAEHFSRLKGDFPTDPTPHRWAIECLTYSRDLDAARKALRLAKHAHPKHEMTWALLEAKILHGSGAYDDAIKGFDGVLKKEPRNSEAAQGKLASLRLSGNHSHANSFIKHVLAHKNTDPGIGIEGAYLARAEGHLDRAVDILEKICGRAQATISDELTLAEVRCERASEDDLRQAEQSCWKVVELDVESSRLFGTLGTICFKRKRYDEAERYLRHSIKLDEGSEYYAVLANMLMLLDRTGECEDVVKSGLRCQPNSAALVVQQGRLLQNSGRAEAAISTFSAALRLDPKSFDAKIGLVGALIKAGRFEELETTLARYSKDEENEIYRAEFSRQLAQLLIKRFEDSNDPSYLERARSQIESQSNVDSLGEFFTQRPDGQLMLIESLVLAISKIILLLCQRYTMIV